jgi:hypothetical protein
LDLLEQAHVGQNLTELRDQSHSCAANLFAALLAPIRAALDARAVAAR